MNQTKHHNNNRRLPPAGKPSMLPRNQRKPGQRDSIPFGFKEAMHFVSKKREVYSQTAAPVVPELQTEGPEEFKWKSSFKPLGDAEDGPSEEKKTSSPKKDELYDPYELVSSDSEPEESQQTDQNEPKPDQDLRSQSLSPKRSSSEQSRWDSSVLRPGSKPLSRLDFGTVTIPNKSQSLSPVHRPPDQRAYSPETEPLSTPSYDSINRLLDPRACSPDRIIPAPSTSHFPFYGAQRTNGEERISGLEYRREVSPVRQITKVRLSPPRIKRDYLQLGPIEKDLDPIPPPSKVTRPANKDTVIDENPITCDLCDVRLGNGQELEDHLESKSHWDTLEYIQQQNGYDDIIIAFLQEVMLYKSRKSSQATEDCALQALQENDHMTKVELFHCAACKVFVSTSASSVQAHITSQEHLSNTREFEAGQRHVCLNKAGSMMKELKPQFELFLQGGSLLE